MNVILPLFRASKRNCKFSANEPYKTNKPDKMTELNRTNALQGDHFPDNIKCPDFSLTFPAEASKDYPVSSVYRYGQQSFFHISEKQG